MIPGMNQRKMQQMMRKMGMQQTEIEAKEVVIRCQDKEIVIENPQVSKVNMMGQETFQIVGTPVEKELTKEPEINQDDIKTVMDQANCDEETAKKAIQENKGDLAASIISLKKE
ncbi:nascent polypeptide-associated complex protein [Candidatus Woesearchaeota archaeon B3_Woes]|nr:MAG: nascent polypeptide-associated complex protein [Candidatus Woesearchaeota archaeon B3_Woes]